jgi:PAS domain S-box-containing protein
MSLSGTDLLERLLDSVPGPVVVADLRGHVLLLNAATERALGYRADEASGHLHVTDLYHRADEARRVLARLAARERLGSRDAEPTFDVTLRARNGELVPVRLTASFLRDRDGQPVATLGLFEDRREQIAIEQRLAESARQVEASERRAAGALAVGTVVHEMAQPLTVAMGNVELLLAADLPDDARARLTRTYEHLEQLRGFLAQIARSGRRTAARDAAGELP